MSTSELRDRLSLPAWARAATVSITEDYANQRMIEVTLELPPITFATRNPAEIADELARTQSELEDEGANIGRTVVRVNDPNTGDPLYIDATDGLWGYQSYWHSPHVLAYAGPAASMRAEAPQAPSLP